MCFWSGRHAIEVKSAVPEAVVMQIEVHSRVPEAVLMQIEVHSSVAEASEKSQIMLS